MFGNEISAVFAEKAFDICPAVGHIPSGARSRLSSLTRYIFFNLCNVFICATDDGLNDWTGQGIPPISSVAEGHSLSRLSLSVSTSISTCVRS